ncbi:HEPN domain-containing protein [Pleomorphomonas sp. JP5]|uniref:HEPN domain-containing protein n=1 Tax=Pleomorphomonas sp. JP5 TaxID=2942998 RepID=UPI0020439B76|nr:HEPN domain-containing protein [Pleomorphomonas sp. JP5]MCM5556268.1 HEPN domain-containing protein [Pleomorphomonas sp. JP5]
MMSKTNPKLNHDKLKNLIHLARDVLSEFNNGTTSVENISAIDFNELGISLFGPHVVRYSEKYIDARRAFSSAAVKVLNAKCAHERTISRLCQEAGQEYVMLVAATENIPGDALDKAAKKLADSVLAEAGHEYTYIEPNFLVRHTVNDIISLGRVRSMPASLVENNTPLHKFSTYIIKEGAYPEQTIENGSLMLGMPDSVWVVSVPATKENASEEAKWLIDVAVSLMRLSTNSWPGNYPYTGDVEAHPTRQIQHPHPFLVMEDNGLTCGGGTLHGWYETSPDVIEQLSGSIIQSKASILFDPPENTLADRVANGLGWMTRGRQVSDRSERLLFFFTSLEALLTSKDKSDPITQTISRHAAVICSQDIPNRVTIFKKMKSLYSLRSDVVHGGKRNVLWSEVNLLQNLVESIFSKVLLNCDLYMTQSEFDQFLSEASHGLPFKGYLEKE